MNRDEIAKLDPFKARHDGEDSIGASVSLSQIQSASNQVSKYAEKADSLVKSGGNSRQEKNAKDVARGIRKVTRSPATAATIAATAAVVPAGTVAAAVMTAGVAVAEACAALASPIAKMIAKRKRGKAARKAKRAARKSRRSARKAGRKYRRAARKAARRGRPAPKAPKLPPMKPSPKAKSAFKKGAKLLAKQIVKAGRGDSKADAALLAFRALADPKLSQAARIRVAVSRGMSRQQAFKLARLSGQPEAMKLMLKDASGLAKAAQKRFPPTRKAPRKRNLKFERMLREATAKLKKSARKKARKPAVKTGLLVSTSLKLSRGKFQNRAGKPGWLVDSRGLVVPGKWQK
jgi:hypothetical protein